MRSNSIEFLYSIRNIMAAYQYITTKLVPALPLHRLDQTVRRIRLGALGSVRLYLF